MILRQASAERLEVMKQTSVKAPWFIALSFGLLGLTPLFAGGVPTLPRIAMSAALFCACAALVAFSRPRAEILSVDLVKRTIEGKDGSIALDQAKRYSLEAGGRASEDEAPRNRYRVELVLEDDRRITWLERSDPARVLGDLRTALRYLPLPVSEGWGLPAGAEPWRTGKKSEPKQLAALSVKGRPHQHELGAAICAIGGVLVIGTVVTLSHGARLERGAHISGLSWTLSGLLLALVALIAGFLLTDRVIVRTSAGALSVERRAFGFRLAQRSIPLASVRGAYAVGPDPAEPLHVLIDAEDEIAAIPLVGEPARRVAKALSPSALDA
jgi:hypothetical protein